MSGNLTLASSLGAASAVNAALDIGLAYNASAGGCDLVAGETDILVDTTPVTGMLMGIGCDARALPTDPLPEDGSAWAQGAPLADLRRGWPGDALDAQGRRNGSRTWIFTERAKADEATRQGVEGAIGEALGQVGLTYGVPMQLTVRWVAPTILGYKAVAGKATLSLTQPVSAAFAAGS